MTPIAKAGPVQPYFGKWEEQTSTKDIALIYNVVKSGKIANMNEKRTL